VPSLKNWREKAKKAGKSYLLPEKQHDFALALLFSAVRNSHFLENGGCNSHFCEKCYNN
jgi:hypothetical protein